MPKEVTGCSMTTSVGTYTFDPVSKQLRWDIGKIQPLKVPTMRGSVSFIVGVASHFLLFRPKNLINWVNQLSSTSMT